MYTKQQVLQFIVADEQPAVAGELVIQQNNPPAKSPVYPIIGEFIAAQEVWLVLNEPLGWVKVLESFKRIALIEFQPLCRHDPIMPFIFFDTTPELRRQEMQLARQLIHLPRTSWESPHGWNEDNRTIAAKLVRIAGAVLGPGKELEWYQELLLHTLIYGGRG